MKKFLFTLMLVAALATPALADCTLPPLPGQTQGPPCSESLTTTPAPELTVPSNEEPEANVTDIARGVVIELLLVMF